MLDDMQINPWPPRLSIGQQVLYWNEDKPRLCKGRIRGREIKEVTGCIEVRYLIQEEMGYMSEPFPESHVYASFDEFVIDHTRRHEDEINRLRNESYYAI